MQTNAIQAALIASAVIADPRNALFDVDTNAPLSVQSFAASDNILFDVSVPSAAEAAAAQLGTREIWIAPVGANGIAAAGDFILLSKLRAGDTGPTPEAVTEDTTFDNGTVTSNQTGVNNGSKTWDIEGSSDNPEIALLIDHCRLEGYGTPEKRGKPFAYIAYNEDRSSFFGGAKVNTASVPREGGHRWSFNIPFETVGLRRSSQNPVAAATGAPAVADVTPDSGPIGTTIRVLGANLAQVAEARLGSQVVDDAAFTVDTDGELAFAVPAGATPGSKAVVVVYADGEVFAGSFEVTA